MILLLSFIHASNAMPGKTITLHAASRVSGIIDVFELRVKQAGNDVMQPRATPQRTREIAAMEADRKVFRLTSAFEKLYGTGNHTSSASVACRTASLISTTPEAAPDTRIRDFFVTPSVSRIPCALPASCGKKPQSESVSGQAKSAFTNPPSISLLTQIKYQFTCIRISAAQYYSSLKKIFRPNQQEKIACFENISRNKAENCGAMGEIINAYSNSPIKALELYNSAKQDIIFREINDFVKKAASKHIKPDITRLCNQANRYAINSGANALFFKINKDNIIERNNLYAVSTSQQRTRNIKAEISNCINTSPTLRRASHCAGERQRANSIQTTAQNMMSDACTKLFNDIHNDKRNIYGTRHSFDLNELRAALPEGQPALAGLRTSSAA